MAEMKQTAMQKLLYQLKEERKNIPMNIEWDRCYQAIEMVIQNTYLPMEKEQIIESFKHGELPPFFVNYNAEEYYKQTYKKL